MIEISLSEFMLTTVYGLIASVIQDGVKLITLSYFQRRKIERRVEDVTAEVVEALLPFLSNEKLSEANQRLLIQTCVNELSPLTKTPEQLFRGSLNGQMIFENLYTNKDLPKEIIDEGLKEVYSLLCPRIAELLCRIPAAIKDWEKEAWSENYRRFDEISLQLRTLFEVVDKLAKTPAYEADQTLIIVRRSLAQKIRFDLDLTGLRADRPLAGKFDDFFVHPEIRENEPSKSEQPLSIGTPSETFSHFTHSYHQAIVFGAPGSGKTIWTKWIQRESLTSHWSGISVRVELRGISPDYLPSLHELVRDTVGKHLAEEMSVNRISQWLDAKIILFVLDGFDEIRPDDRNMILEWIIDLTSAARGCPFILTSRPLTTNHLDILGNQWHKWKIEPFDETRIVDYITRWYSFSPLILENSKEIDAKVLANNWRKDPTIGPLTGNPLLLSTLLMVHQLDGSLPNGRSQLYRRYVEGMLGLWDDRRNVSASSIKLSQIQKKQIVSQFALHLFLAKVDQIDEKEATDLVDSILNKMLLGFSANDVLDAIRERSGLIIGPGIYSFAHKSIAEYLVADAIIQGDHRDSAGKRLDRFYLFENCEDDRWNTVIFLWAGLAPISDLETFIEGCMRTNTWNLTFGLLRDQSERLPRDIYKNLLSRSFSKFEEINKCIDPHGIGYATYGPHNILERDKGFQFRIPNFAIRTLTGDPNVFIYFIDLISKKIVSWNDLAAVHGPLKDIFWIFFATSAPTIDDWQSCLKSKCPESNTQLNWSFKALSDMVRNLIETDVLIESYFDAFVACLPDYAWMVPLVSLSNIIHLATEKEDTSNQEFQAQPPQNLLNGIVRYSENQIPARWLSDTRYWEIDYARPLTVDLLSVALDELKQLAEVDRGEQISNLLHKSVDYVEELIEKRKKLDESAG